MNDIVPPRTTLTLHTSSAIPAVASAITFGTRTTFEVEKSMATGAQDRKNARTRNGGDGKHHRNHRTKREDLRKY